MKEIPDCKLCKLKCHGCSGYHTCLMRQEINGHRITDCKLMASKYYLWDKYLDTHNMNLCRYQDECQSAVNAWL